jgi:uncharacterized protein involved in exopolysaccharide biosynthesis
MEPTSSLASTTPGAAERLRAHAPLLALFVSDWRLLAVGLVVGGALGAAAALVLPKWYESEVVLAMVPVDDPATLGRTNAPDGAASELPILTAVLHTRRVADETVRRLDLVRAWGLRSADEARATLWSRLSVMVDRKSSFLTLRVEDRRPERAREILLALTSVANDVQGELWSSRLREHRRRLDERRVELGAALAAAEEALRDFKRRHHVVALDEQIKATVEQAAALEKIRQEKQLGLDFAAGFASPGSPEMLQAQREVRGARQALRSLGTAGGLGPGLPLDTLPALEVEHARLQRDVDAKSAAYALLQRQIDELATIESRPSGRADVVDPPTIPRRPHRPAKSALGLEGSFIGLVLAVLLVLLRARRRDDRPSPRAAF